MKEGVRLQKVLAQGGVASRRAAERLIAEGRVEVNGARVTELGTKVDPDRDTITVDGEPLASGSVKATIVLDKPAGVVTTMRDDRGRPTVADLVKDEPYRLYPVGRLDFPTEGVLLMTTDGELANRLLHPRYKAPKVYVVKVRGRPGDAVLARLASGVQLEDGMTLPAMVEVLEEGDRHTWLEIVLTEGRQRQIRRMCEAIGHDALRVVRTAFATVTAEGLRSGEYRYLTEEELAAVYRTAGMEDEMPEPAPRAYETGLRPLGESWRRKGPFPGAERKPKGPGPAAGKKKPARTKRPREEEPPEPKGIRPSEYRKKHERG